MELSDCIFCKIVSKEISTKILVETESCIGFLDAFPLAKGHALVIPKRHYEKLQDLPINVNTEVFSTVHSLISKVDSLTGATLVAVHNGKQSGQEIPHVHVHLIPRSEDDSAGAVHSMFSKKPDLSESEIEELCSKLRIN
uniref:Histidine triad (HIT) protein (Hit) n=1 Tax=uncultured marine thaumarchaeote KM3_11_F08 TaxID=1455992 RepID=A0A075G909_9ARCH|nr:histidine triad (HIT) protein (hit) [uncultured marine thaumarchaeote KM3_11_F08]